MFWRKIIDYFLDDIHQKLFLWQGKTTLYEAQVKTQKWADKWIENEKKSFDLLPKDCKFQGDFLVHENLYPILLIL